MELNFDERENVLLAIKGRKEVIKSSICYQSKEVVAMAQKLKDKTEFEMEEFVVDTTNKGVYKKFIVSLHEQLRQLAKKSVRNCPVLPIEEDGKRIPWFDIGLKTVKKSIRLSIRLSNLYLVGYQMENKQWLEFGNSNPLIPKSKFLGFGGDNGSLVQRTLQKPKNTSLTDPSHMMEKIGVSKQTLVDAVNKLATTTDDDRDCDKKRARSLIIVIMMFCESIRFIPISDHLTTNFLKVEEKGKETLIHPWIIDLIHTWEDLSRELLKADADPERSLELTNTIEILKPPQDVARKISTLTDAADVLGILLGFKKLEKGKKGKKGTQKKGKRSQKSKNSNLFSQIMSRYVI